ncbi:MAG: RimK family alpha-L-glutamate ligase [Armatimonadota bacterium]|nr:RimK family alpha-L-glutamate ligase [Armatimonadota bacterium]
MLGPQDNWHVRELARALATRRITATVVETSTLLARVGGVPALSGSGIALDDADLVLVRSVPGGSLEQVIFRVDALHVLEAMGVRVINPPRSIERTVDKFLTSKLLEMRGIPTPRTVVAQSVNEAMDAFHAMGDVVVKPLFGGQGVGMVRVADPDLAWRTFKALKVGRAIYYVQEFIPHGHEDVRVLVIAGTVVAGITRSGSSWKTNLAQGAVARPWMPDPVVAGLSVQATAAVEAVYAGVDLLRHPDGRWYVVEVNGIPGWQGLQAATHVNVAQTLVDALIPAATP